MGKELPGLINASGHVMESNDNKQICECEM